MEATKTFFRNQSKTFWLLVAFYWFVSFGRSVLPTHLSAQGLSLSQILFGSVLVMAGQLVILFLLGLSGKKYKSKSIWYYALTLYVLFFLLSGFQIASVWQYYIGSLLAGIGSVLFYLYYNIGYFRETQEGKLYSHTAKFFNILVIISVITPLVAGSIATLNFSWIVLLAVVFFGVAIWAVSKQEGFEYSFLLKETIAKLKGAKKIILLDGLYDSLNWGIIGIFTLKFIKSPLEFGGFLSYLAIISVVSNIVFSSLGDKYKKGHIVAGFAAVLMSGCLILLGFSTSNLFSWAIATGVIKLLGPLFSSSVLALSLERSEDKIVSMPAREIIINVGRFIGVALAWIFFTLHFPGWSIFALPALAVLALGWIALRLKTDILV